MNHYQLTINNYPLYKDSGVEWLGDVPEHWEIKKLKDIISVKSGESIKIIDTLDRDFMGENFPVFGGNGIMGYTDKYNCSGDTLVIGRVGAKCGNIRYTPFPLKKYTFRLRQKCVLKF
jgi:type I restriction enzyme S subunit